jgi:hypothetical protein
MAINLAKNYSPILDEIYKAASVTEGLVSGADTVRAGTNVNEICYPQIEVTGLGDYDRNSGYVDGSVNVEWKTTKFNYDRGEKISVDCMDDEETFEIAFGQAAQTLIKTQVAPEGDAFTFATLAGTEGVSEATGTLADGEAVLAALVAATTKMDEDEVPAENRKLFATPTVLNSIKALDTYKSREVLEGFAEIKKVPQSRFYTGIELKKGGADGYGFVKAADAADINFMIVEPSCLIKFDKHVASNVISPENNPNSDAYIVKYRKYGIVDVYKNKVAGIYCHHK